MLNTIKLDDYERLVYDRLLDEWEGDHSLNPDHFESWIRNRMNAELGFDVFGGE